MKKSIRLIINTLADNYRSFDIEYLRDGHDAHEFKTHAPTERMANNILELYRDTLSSPGDEVVILEPRHRSMATA